MPIYLELHMEYTNGCWLELFIWTSAVTTPDFHYVVQQTKQIQDNDIITTSVGIWNKEIKSIF